jgi:hypothetical protein
MSLVLQASKELLSHANEVVVVHREGPSLELDQFANLNPGIVGEESDLFLDDSTDLIPSAMSKESVEVVHSLDS